MSADTEAAEAEAAAHAASREALGRRRDELVAALTAVNDALDPDGPGIMIVGSLRRERDRRAAEEFTRNEARAAGALRPNGTIDMPRLMRHLHQMIETAERHQRAFRVFLDEATRVRGAAR